MISSSRIPCSLQATLVVVLSRSSDNCYAGDKVLPVVIVQGPSSRNPLAYRWYNAEEVILGKKMKVEGNSIRPTNSSVHSKTSSALMLNLSEVVSWVSFGLHKSFVLTVPFHNAGLVKVQRGLLAFIQRRWRWSIRISNEGLALGGRLWFSGDG